MGLIAETTLVARISSALKIANDDLSAKVRRVLKEHGRLDADAETLSDDDDLYAAGLTSHASVNVMLALESEFELEFPDQMLKRGTFDSVASICSAIAALLEPS